MPRRPRMVVPGVPCHVITRGNDRKACFFSETDYNFYLDCLRDAMDRYAASLHAYVLMTNHVHLLITPEKTDSIAKVMQSIGRRYVQYINKRYRRSGTLWEGRYKSSLVLNERYVLACYRYIELNPVRACMVADPQDYLWSSYGINALGKNSDLLTMHQCYKELGDEGNRCKNYRELCKVYDKHAESQIRVASLFSIPMQKTRQTVAVKRTGSRQRPSQK